MRNLFIAAAAAISTAFAGAAMADPNIDMSQFKIDGGFTVDVTSQSIAGAIIQGNGPGRITASSGAFNVAGGEGGFSGGIDLDTDNAGAGVSGFFEGGAGAVFTTGVTGGAFANTTGVGETIEVTAGQFGSATMGWSGTIETKLQSDDWN